MGMLNPALLSLQACNHPEDASSHMAEAHTLLGKCQPANNGLQKQKQRLQEVLQQLMAAQGE